MNVDMNNALVVGLTTPTSCVHIIDGNNYETMVEDDNIIQLISERSKVDLLEVNSSTQISPNPLWFGAEPEHDWCYYYQKASLYRQQKRWTDLVELADEVQKIGLAPLSVDEWLPMYEGYLQTYRVDDANNLANILKSDEAFVINYCPSKLSLLENGNDIQKNIIGDLCSWYIDKYR